jgi:ATP-dependent exoDNAse (exonuclease V) alpha subunit
VAIYHLSAQVISRKAGRSSTAASAYRAGEKIEDRRTGEIFDFTRKGGVYGSGILAPTGAPTWATDRGELWNRVEQVEIRKDAQVCREIDIALPVELGPEQRVETVRDFVQSQFVDHGMIADVAFHDFDSHNPHAHIMLTMREIGLEGFGKKIRDWNRRELVTKWREAWAKYANGALALAGTEDRIDHRSYEAQGLDWEPAQHMGPAVAGMERRKPSSTRIGRENKEREERNLVREMMAQDTEEDQIYINWAEVLLDDFALELKRLEIEIEIEAKQCDYDKSELEKDYLRASEKAHNASETIAQVGPGLGLQKATVEALEPQYKPEQNPFDFLDDDGYDPNAGPSNS